MYEMEGPRRVPPRTADPVARACALRRDIRLADLASQLPGRRLRRDSRRATLVSRLPSLLVRRDSRRATFVSRSPGRRLRRDVRPLPWQPIARPPCATWRKLSSESSESG